MAAFVHGSVAKRSDTARSDIDLLALESRFDLAYDAALEIRCILYPFGYNNPMATIIATEDFTNWLAQAARHQGQSRDR